MTDGVWKKIAKNVIYQGWKCMIWGVKCNDLADLKNKRQQIINY